MKISLMRIVLSVAAFLYAPLAYAADKGFTALAPIPGLTDTAITGSSGFADFFNKLYVYLIGAAVILAIIMIVWGGLEYSTQDSVSKKSDGKSKIYNALFGLVLILSPVLVFTIINPKILNLNVNFPALNTTWGTKTGSTATGSAPQDLLDQVCAGYTKFETTVVPSGQFCKDVLGAGWVSIGGDTSCTGTAIPTGSTQCAFNQNYVPTTPIATSPPPPSESYYTDSDSIPSGSWCYQINAGYICGDNQGACDALAGNESSSIVASCVAH